MWFLKARGLLIFVFAVALPVLEAGCGGDSKGEPGAGDGGMDSPDDAAEPTLSELLDGIDMGTKWADVPEPTREALEAHALAVAEARRAEWGAGGLEEKTMALLEAPTEAMDAALYEFLYGFFGYLLAEDFTGFTNGDFELTLRKLYLAYIGAHGTLAVTYGGLSAIDWNGETPLSRHPIPDEELVADLADYAAVVHDELLAYDDSDLTAEEQAVRAEALFYARQLRGGSLGFGLGSDDLLTPTGVARFAWDFLFERAPLEVRGSEPLLVDGDEFLEQVNAYFWLSPNRTLDRSLAAGLDDLFASALNVDEIAAYLGAGQDAKAFALLGAWYVERTKASDAASAECVLVTEGARTRLWDAFAADNFQPGGDASDFLAFSDDFGAYSLSLEARQRQYVLDALEAFRVARGYEDSAVADAKAAVLAEDGYGNLIGAAKSGLIGGDAAAFEDTLASVTYVGGYLAGAGVSLSDETKVQAAWTRTRAFLIERYSLEEGELPDSVTVENGDTTDAYDDGSVAVGIASALHLGELYQTLLRAAYQSLAYTRMAEGGSAPSGALLGGAAEIAASELLPDLLDAALPSEGALEPARRAFYLAGLGDQSFFLAASDLALARYLRDECGEGNALTFAQSFADRWGVTNLEERGYLAARASQGMTYLAFAYGEASVWATLGRLNEGWGTPADALTLLACDLAAPDVSGGALVATRAALESCVAGW
jgi:hypothetical protein